MKYDFMLDMDSDNSLSMILRGIKANTWVMEFGPAMGRMTRYLKEKLSCHVVIVELDEEGYQSAIQYAEDGFCGDAETLEWKEHFQSCKFDYIIFADILEHLRNPQAVLAAAVDMLAEDGQIALSVPNIAHNSVMINLYNGRFDYHNVGLLDDTHIHFFTYDTMKNMLDACGLDTVYEDATLAECESTEFGNSLFELPPEVRLSMKQRDYAYVYQFIFFCKKKEVSVDHYATPKMAYHIAKNHAEEATVFLDLGEGYKEEHKICQPVKAGENQLSFTIEHPEFVKNIRIDFAEAPCYIRLIRIEVDGQELEQGNLRSNCSWMENREYEFITIDPQLEFEVGEFSGDLQIQFFLEFLTLDVLDNLARRKMEKLDLQQELIQSEQQKFVLECEKSALEREKFASEREKITLELDSEREKNALLESQKKDLLLDKARVKAQIEQMNVNHANEIQALHERYLAEIQVIYQSSSWKVTKPYRFIARSLKKIGRILMPRKVRQGLFIILHEGFSVFFQRLSAYRNRKHAEKLFVSRLLSPTHEMLREQKEYSFERKICFSIVVPLYNTPKKYLVDMIESCQNQTYANWELCLADGSDGEHAYVGHVVRQMASKDHRIKYKVLEKNSGISENTNAALEMASGDYIALLDHDDLLHPAALYEYMKVICEQEADFIYCDEMTFEGKLSHIITLHFKPDFAIDNLRANNYICHFSVFSKELLQKAGMFRKEFDGSQDHDMILRLTEQAERIVHVPQILYFWRSHPASVASDINSKTYAIDAGKRAVLSHMERCGLKGSVESSWAFPTIFNVKYELQEHALISIIIPNKDNVAMLSRCLASIIDKSTYDNYEILVVENNSTEDLTFHYYDTLQSNPKVEVLYYEEEGFNYARINNFAAEHAGGKYLLFLNNDIEIITPEWMEEMLMFAQREDVGAVGAKLYYPDNTIQHAGVVVGMGADRCAGSPHHRYARDNVGYIGRLCYAQDFSAVTAACMLVSREIFQSVGGFDEKFAVAYNDVDLCMAIREAGYKNIWTPCAEAYHYESVSRGYDNAPEKQERFQREVKLFKEKWEKQIEQGDPYYNKNLTLDLPDFSPKIG